MAHDTSRPDWPVLDDWTVIDFRRWLRGLHRSAWVGAGYMGQATLIQAARAAGFNGLIPKPFEIAAVFEHLASVA